MGDGIQKKSATVISNSHLPSTICQLLFRGCPALAHQADQMLQRLFVAAALFGSELMGAFVELRGHLGGFIGRTTERDKNLG